MLSTGSCVRRILGIFWVADETTYKSSTRKEPVNYGIHSDASFTLIYGICNDPNANHVQIKLKNDELVNTNLSDTRIFISIMEIRFIGSI